MHNWFVFDQFNEASTAAADFLSAIIKATIEKNGRCHIALPGGNTPSHCLTYLATKAIAWDKVHWYLGDERCFPQGHAERNDVMLEKHLWSKLTLPHIHRIAAEAGPEKAAEQYRQIIEAIGRIDIAFLGVGEDGHTASLFPGNPALNDSRSVVPVFSSPKLPAERVSLGITTLQKANFRIVLAGGKGKADVIKQIKSGEALPVNQIGEINWFIDREAVGKS